MLYLRCPVMMVTKKLDNFDLTSVVLHMSRTEYNTEVLIGSVYVWLCLSKFLNSLVVLRLSQSNKLQSWKWKELFKSSQDLRTFCEVSCGTWLIHKQRVRLDLYLSIFGFQYFSSSVFSFLQMWEIVVQGQRVRPVQTSVGFRFSLTKLERTE